VSHGSPAESRAAFAPGSVLVLPIDLASGVRMRILEAWARGVAIVATPEAASGLGFVDDRELALATTPEEFAGAVRALFSELGLYARRVDAGRERLASDHDPKRIAELWEATARSVAAGGEKR
jgi:glycosyltransferase involved in cell wall biosynthesis